MIIIIGLEYILELYQVQQKEIAEMLEIKTPNISRWMKGERSIPEKYVDSLSKYFKIPPEYITKQIDEIDRLEIQKNKLENENTKIICYEKFKTFDREIIDLRVEKYEKDVQEKIDLIGKEIRKIHLLNNIKSILDEDKSLYNTFILFTKVAVLYDDFDEFTSKVLFDVINSVELSAIKDEDHVVKMLAYEENPIMTDMILLLKKYTLNTNGKIVLKENWKEELYRLHKQLDSLKQEQ